MFKTIFYYLWRFYKFLTDFYVLEVHLAEHCNLNCISCSHYSPLAKPIFLNLQEFEGNMNELKARKAWLLFPELHLLGGEPLLHPDIIAVIRIVRKCFPVSHTKIKIITNGLFLKSMPDSFWEACQKYSIEIGISVYPIKTDYEAIMNLCRERQIKHEIYGNHKRQTSFEQFKLSKVKEGDWKTYWHNYYHCFVPYCLQLVGDKIFPCAQCAYVVHLNEALGYKFKHSNSDYLPIYKLSKIRLILFRLHAKPFCAYCLLPRPKVNWKLSERKAEEWIVEGET